MSFLGKAAGVAGNLFGGPVGSEFFEGLVDGEEYVAEQAEEEAQLEEVGEYVPDGAKQFYEGASELPGIGEVLKLPKAAWDLSHGAGKLGASCNEGLGDVRDTMERWRRQAHGME